MTLGQLRLHELGGGTLRQTRAHPLVTEVLKEECFKNAAAARAFATEHYGANQRRIQHQVIAFQRSCAKATAAPTMTIGRP